MSDDLRYRPPILDPDTQSGFPAQAFGTNIVGQTLRDWRHPLPGSVSPFAPLPGDPPGIKSAAEHLDLAPDYLAGQPHPTSKYLKDLMQHWSRPTTQMEGRKPDIGERTREHIHRGLGGYAVDAPNSHWAPWVDQAMPYTGNMPAYDERGSQNPEREPPSFKLPNSRNPILELEELSKRLGKVRKL